MRAVTTPIFQNSLFTFPDCESRSANWDHPSQYDYTRFSNPTTAVAEAKIAAMEGGESARCFGSGMGAVSAAVLACIRAGDHIVAPETVYGPARQLLSSYLDRFDVSVTYVPGVDPGDYRSAMRPNTRLLYLESPSSLVMRQQDLEAVADMAKAAGASTVCDNSWATPYFQTPLRHGVDLVVHSATKYLGGHSDIIAGAVVGSAVRIGAIGAQEGSLLGSVLDPFAAWLLIRGIRTLSIRMDRHQQSTKLLARRLADHSAVAHVYYPGMSEDPQPELTRKQLRGTSGLFSFALKDNRREAHFRLVNALHYFGIGCSWGGFESLAMPASVSMSAAGGEGRGCRWLIRLSIGLENVEDLWADLERALGVAAA
jgi:cystathionine beta-lyase/cystathionine gamma-synthase